MEEGRGEIEMQPKSESVSMQNAVRKVRNELLVVAALIAAAASQGLASIPDGVKKGPKETLAAYICANTIAFITSLTMLEYMTDGFPYGRELKVSYFALAISIGISSVAQLKNPGSLTIISLSLCFAIPLLLRVSRLFPCFKPAYKL